MRRARHRRQAAEGSWAARFGCTAVAALVAMDQATRGGVGPAISADAFRARQPDQAEGIDLHDARIAAASFGVELEVRAAYGGTTAATWSELVELGEPGVRRALVIQGGHDRLPDRLRCADFRGPHAVESPGWIADPTDPAGRSWLVSNPLCSSYVLWPDAVMRAFTEALAGPRHVFVAAAPPTPYGEEETVDPNVLIPIAVCDVEAGGTLYGDPDRRTILGAIWPGGTGIGLYALPAAVAPANLLLPIRYDKRGGPAVDLVVAWIGADKVRNVRVIVQP